MELFAFEYQKVTHYLLILCAALLIISFGNARLHIAVLLFLLLFVTVRAFCD